MNWQKCTDAKLKAMTLSPTAMLLSRQRSKRIAQNIDSLKKPVWFYRTSSLPPVSLMAAAGNSKSVRVLAPLKSMSRDQDQHADLDDPI